MMKIKNIYCLSGDEYHDLIETPDGKLYTFHIVPFRPLMQRDLTPVNTQLPTDMYLKAAHAFRPTESYPLARYGLELESHSHTQDDHGLKEAMAKLESRGAGARGCPSKDRGLDILTGSLSKRALSARLLFAIAFPKGFNFGH